MLILAAKRALTLLKAELASILEANSLLDGNGQPRRETLEPDASPWVDEYEEAIGQLETAIAAAQVAA
jgi:hypothetical protein